MKTYTAIIASLLFAGGSASALAVEGMNDNRSQEGADPTFSVIDSDGDGYINQEDAEGAGISQREFEEMNESGDGNVSEEEFRNYQDQQDSDRRDQPGAANPQDSQQGMPGDVQPEGERGVPGEQREGLPGTEPGIPGSGPEGQPGTQPGVPGTQPEGQPGTEPGVPGQQPGATPQSPQQPGAVPGGTQP